jgi:hypothetical protein
MSADLTAIRQRLEKATPGPWKVYPHEGSPRNLRIGTEWNHAQLHGPAGVVNLSTAVNGNKPEVQMAIDPADADLIAHAPADIRALIDEVEALREQLARYHREAKINAGLD